MSIIIILYVNIFGRLPAVVLGQQSLGVLMCIGDVLTAPTVSQIYLTIGKTWDTPDLCYITG